MKENLQALIKGNDLFKELDDKDIDILVKFADIEEYEADKFIFSAREPATRFYLVISGEISIQMFSQEKGSISLEEIKEGEMVGWSWMNEPYMWKYDCLAIKDSKLICFDAVKIKNKMDTNNKFGYKLQKIFTRIIIERLQATQLRLHKEFGDNIFIPD